MKTKISFSQPSIESEVICGANVFEDAIAKLMDSHHSRVFAIVDRNVYEYYSQSILRPLVDRAVVHIFPPGEEQKSYENAQRLLTWLLSEGADRMSLLIGVGGGVVTDISGYVAATFMRGIPSAAVATTLVGQVDAAIGGKTAVNLDQTKNIIGAFHFPSLVVCDSRFLASLDDEQIRDGLIEAYKIFAAYSRECWLEERARSTSYLSGKDLEKLVSRAASLKCEVVSKDPFERDLRRVLNFGHTAGHAIETESGCSHGKAVAAGIMVALELSVELAGLDRSQADEISALFTSMNSANPTSDLESGQLWSRIQRDKKKSGDQINFVLLKSCGEHIVKTVDYSQFQAAYDKARAGLR